MALPTPRRFLNAFKRMQVTDLQKQILDIHLNSPGRTTTPGKIAVALGFTHHAPVCSAYGRLGKELGKELKWTPEDHGRQGLSRLAVLEKHLGIWRWVMRPEVAGAVTALGWVVPREPPLPGEENQSDIFGVGLPLMVKHPEVGEKLIAEIFAYRGGAVIFDCGWVFGGHPVHMLPGPIVKKGEGCWSFGDTQGEGDITVQVVTRREFPLLALQAELWEEFKQLSQGKAASRERAHEIFTASFGAGRP